VTTGPSRRPLTLERDRGRRRVVLHDL